MSISAMKQALEALEKLWDIIDDIDTYGDMAKSDDKLYRSLVERRQRQRFEQTGISTDGYELNGGAITALRQAIAEAEKPAHTDHPSRHWDRTCPACVYESDISQERVDETAKREHEPYGYLWFTHQMERRFTHYRPKEEQRIGEVTPIYTAPPKREWVGLTEEEIYDYADKFLYQHGSNYGIKSFGKAIEAKLKEKNT